MKKKTIAFLLILAALTVVSYTQQEAAKNAASQKDHTPIYIWSIIVGGAAITIAAIGGALSQSKAIRNAADNIGRNPEAADSIRGLTIIGIALIESLVIYVLLVDIFIFLFKWGNY